MTSYRLLYILFFFCFLTESAFAQEINRKITFNHFSSKDGLSSDECWRLFQDSQGFIWIGTYNGVSRFDGHEFVTFEIDKLDSTKLQTALIQPIAEDKNGDIWIGTINAGIVRYDTKLEQFKHFRPDKSNPNRPLSDRIIKLTSDTAGNIIFGTSRSGIGKVHIQKGSKQVRFENLTFKPAKTSKKKNNSNVIFCIYVDSHNDLWVNTNALYRIKNSDLSQTPELMNQPWASISCIGEDSNGELFYAIGNALYQYMPKWSKKNKRWFRPVKTDSAFKAFKATTSRFVFDDNNNLIMVDEYVGMAVAKLDSDKGTLSLLDHYTAKDEGEQNLRTNAIRDIIKDKSGVVWLASANHGIYNFDLYKKQFLHLKKNKQAGSLQGNLIYSIFEDSHKNLWTSIYGVGIQVLPHTAKNYTGFKLLNAKNGVSSKRIQHIGESITQEQSALWLGSWGLYQWKHKTGAVPDTAKFFHHKPRKKVKFPKAWFESGTYFCSLQTRDSVFWLGNYSLGLSRVELGPNNTPKRVYHFKQNPSIPNGLQSNTVRDIIQDKFGSIWLATSKGLHKMLGTGKDSVPPTFQVFMFDENDPNSIPHNTFLCLYEDKAGTLWAGALGGGLIKVLRDHAGQVVGFKQYGTDEGMPDMVIKKILEDKKGNLWISSSGGLTQFNPEKESIKNYTEEDGIQSNNFRDNSGCLRQNGQMLFGGMNGLTVFNPDSIKDNPFLANVLLTDFKVYGKSVKPNQKINDHVVINKSITFADTVIVSYKENVIEFGFAALHYAVPGKNQLKYKLEGFDEDWIVAQNDRKFAIYSNLNGGNYTFRVMAANNDGVWNPKVRSIELIVLPPWWKTLWFKILAIVVVTGGAFAYYTYRMRAVKKENERLESLVNQRTQKLKQANVELEEQKEEILSQNEEIKQKAEELHSMNDELQDQRDTIMESFENMQTLGEFGQHITSVLTFDDIADIVAKYLTNFMQADAYGMGVLAPKRQEVIFSSFFRNNTKEEIFSGELNEPFSLSAKCLRENIGILSNSFEDEFKEYLSNSPEIQADYPPKSAIYMPLLIDKKPVGVLIVHHSEINAYTTQHQSILKNLASYLSIAMSNAKSYELIHQKNNDINSSIRYAQTIQQAILPLDKRIGQYFNFFSIFLPKDVVSGDFYWFSAIKRPKQSDLLLFAVIDCTGHGVPGAIMSIVSNGALTRIVKERNILEPAAILEALDMEVRKILKQDTSENTDGMDVCLCSFQEQQGSYQLQFAASKRPLYVFRQQEKRLEIRKGTRRYIGGIKSHKTVPFENQSLTLGKGDMVYLSSDGFVDQHGPSRSRYGSKRLLALLQEIATQPVAQQKEALMLDFETHKSEENQRDDVTFVGLQLP